MFLNSITFVIFIKLVNIIVQIVIFFLYINEYQQYALVHNIQLLQAYSCVPCVKKHYLYIHTCGIAQYRELYNLYHQLYNLLLLSFTNPLHNFLISTTMQYSYRKLFLKILIHKLSTMYFFVYVQSCKYEIYYIVLTSPPSFTCCINQSIDDIFHMDGQPASNPLKVSFSYFFNYYYFLRWKLRWWQQRTRYTSSVPRICSQAKHVCIGMQMNGT